MSRRRGGGREDGGFWWGLPPIGNPPYEGFCCGGRGRLSSVVIVVVVVTVDAAVDAAVDSTAIDIAYIVEILFHSCP